MVNDFSQKEIITRIWNETQKQSELLTTLSSEMKSVKEQTTKTNGRVTKLETDVHDVQKTQEGMLVKIGGFTLVATVVVSEFVRRIL